MIKTNFSLEIRKRFQLAEWPWLLLSLRQDEVIWKTLDKTELGPKALDFFPAKPEAWFPAAIALFALDNPISLTSLRSEPLQRLEESLFHRASQTYEEWIKEPKFPEDLKTAGLLALTFREQYRVNGSWQKTLRSVSLNPVTARTPLACLYGMIPESTGLMQALLGTNDENWVKLGVHVLLANPSPPETQLATLKALSADLDPSALLAILQALSNSRPNLAGLFARQVLEEQHINWTTKPVSLVDEEEAIGFEKLSQNMKIAKMHEIAGQADLAVPVLADGLRLIRKMRGYVSAQLGHSVAMTKDITADGWDNTALDASVEAWKQAVQLAPEESRYAAGYARALFQSGRVTEAESFLENYIDEASNKLHPELMLVYAQILDKTGRGESTRQAALKALDLFGQRSNLTEKEAVSLAAYFFDAKDLDNAFIAAQRGLELYPASRELLGLLGKVQFALNKPDEAATTVYASQAASVYEPVGKPVTATASNGFEDVWHSAAINDLTIDGIQRLLVESLESMRAWDLAYEERTTLLEGQEHPSQDDLRALATSAIAAEKYEKAVEICRQLLQEAPNDLFLNSTLAEAAEGLKDYKTAIEYFNRAIQFAPEQGALWRGLVRAQKGTGDHDAAFETLRAASQALPEDAEIQLQLGELYRLQGSPTQALPYLRRANTGDISTEAAEKAAYLLGDTLYQLGRMEESLQVLEPVYLLNQERNLELAQTPGYEYGYEDSAPDLGQAYARTLLALGQPEKSVPVLSQVVKERPEDPAASLDLVKALMQLDDQASGAKRAIPFLQRLLGLAPDGSASNFQSVMEANPRLRAEARVLLAEAYAAVGDWEPAMDAFRKALEDPANHERDMQTRLSLGLGMTALKLELPEMAVAALKEAAESEPLNAQILRSLCDAYISNGLPQDAFMAAKGTLDLAPSDIETLMWFIQQAMSIAKLPGAARQSIYDEVVQALQTALQQDPESADLLIQLGNVFLETDRRTEAVDIFHKLASIDLDQQTISIKSLYKIGLDMLETGEAQLAVDLLRKAIGKFESNSSIDRPIDYGFSLSDLYEALVRALMQLGDLDEALKVIDQALLLDKARVAFYAAKADILFELGKFELARQDLENALQRWPENVGLHYRMARTSRALGDLPAALHEAETGIRLGEDNKDTAQSRELFTLAAKIAFASLRPRRAFAYLQKAVPEQDPDYNQFEHAILRAEYALEAGEEQAAARAVIHFEGQSTESPRAMAVVGRLAVREGDREEADKKCRSAVRMWTKFQMGQPGIKPATNKDDFMAELSSVGMAALENRQWEQALSIFRQMVIMFPEEPLAHYKLAQALMICSEAQALCQEFEVVKNAPGPNSLLEPAFQEFEQNMKSAAAQVGSADLLVGNGILEDWDVEIKRSIRLCSRRGRACFKPILENATELEYLLQTITPESDDMAALVMAYRRCGAKDRAIKSIKEVWKPTFDGRDVRSETQVIAQQALSEIEEIKSIDLIQKLVSSTPVNKMIWPELPMLHFLLAKLYYKKEDYPTARDEVQKSLSSWPDEPRWQAFAAKIKLSEPSENRSQQLAEAVGYLEKAVSIEPANANHQFELGKIYLESGQVKRALQCLQEAAKLQPGNSESWLELAKAQRLNGELEQAALSADKAIEKSNQQMDALLLRGEIGIETGNYRNALTKAEIALRENPDQPKALYLQAKALAGLNRPVEALSVIEKALPLFESPLSMQLERLQLIKKSQGLEAGLKGLQELVAQNPKNAGYLALLADWLLEAGKQDAAIQAARLALQEGLEGLNVSQRADLHTLIGLHMRKVGQLDQAIHHLSEAINQSSDHMEAYLELGRVYQERREYQQALKVYQKAINLAGGDFRPYYQAGLVLKDSKDYMAAEAMLHRAAQLAPNEVAVHRLLGAVVALNLVHSHRLVPKESSGD